MTHRRDPHGRGRIVHPDDAIRYRRLFTLAFPVFVLCGIFPPLIVPAVIAAVLIIRRERARRHRPLTEHQRVIARGNRPL